MASLIETWFDKCASLRRVIHATLRLRKVFPSELINPIITDCLVRYFKSGKLDYQNADTPRASKKYVKAMKKLPVSNSPCRYDLHILTALGNDTTAH